MRRRERARLHMRDMQPSIEGLLVKKPRTIMGHYELIDVTLVESQTDRHPLDSKRTLVPYDQVLFVEVVR